MVVALWHMLKRRVPHHDLGADYFDRLHTERIRRHHVRRLQKNVRAIFDDGLAGLIGILQDRGVDMDYHLVVLGRRARIDAVVECGLGQQLQRVGLLLRHRRRLRGNVLRLSSRPWVCSR